MAIVPRVNKEEDASGRPNQGKRGWNTRSHQPPRQVYVTTDDTVDGAEEDEMEDAGHDAEQLVEGELEVLMPQAAKKRAQIEKGPRFHAERVLGGPREKDQEYERQDALLGLQVPRQDGVWALAWGQGQQVPECARSDRRTP